MTNLTHRIARAALVGGLAAGLALPAVAGHAAPAGHARSAHAATRDPADLGKHRQQVADRIDERLTALTKQIKTLADAPEVTRPHRAALTGIIGREQAALTALRAKVLAERTHQALRADSAALIREHASFALINPKVRFVVAADTDAGTAADLTKQRGRLVGRVAKATAAGADTRTVETSLANLRVAVERAIGLLRGQADAALAAMTPAALGAVHRTLEQAHTQIRAGLTEARTIRAFLAALPPGKK